MTGHYEFNGPPKIEMYPAIYNLGRYMSHLVSDGRSLLLYDAQGGSGRSADWAYDYAPGCTGFCNIVNVRVQVKRNFTTINFATGWTQVVSTNSGFLFYRSSDGFHAMADVSAQGDFRVRSNSVRYLDPGYTAIAASGTDIEFYNKETGDGAVGHVVPVSDFSVVQAWGTLEIDQRFPGAFAPVYTHLVSVAFPPPAPQF